MRRLLRPNKIRIGGQVTWREFMRLFWSRAVCLALGFMAGYYGPTLHW